MVNRICGAIGASSRELRRLELHRDGLFVDRDRHQRVALGVIVIEAARQSLAGVHREIKLELIAAAGGRVGPPRVCYLRADIAIAEIERLAPGPLHARGTLEEARQLGQRDRLRLVEVAGGMSFAQQFHEGGGFIGHCELLQVDRLAAPWRAHRRRRRNRVDMGITPADRAGLPPFGRAGVKQQIMEIPDHQLLVALGRTQAVAVLADPEQDIAVEQQADELESGKPGLPAQRADLLRR